MALHAPAADRDAGRVPGRGGRSGSRRPGLWPRLALVTG